MSGAWQSALPNAHDLVHQAMKAAAKMENIQNASVSVALADDADIQDLNKRFRGFDKPTDVLSFPMDGPDTQGERLLGDIIISLTTLEKDAKDAAKALDAHFVHLVIHGFLHLLSYDHEQDEEALAMEKTEALILNQLGYDNPYKEG